MIAFLFFHRQMYSSGNGTERSRITKLVQPGEVVVDMFCGIGYYSLPILVHTEVSFLCIKEKMFYGHFTQTSIRPNVSCALTGILKPYAA